MALPAAKVYRMLGNESIWRLAKRCHELLGNAQVPYAVCGGVAVCLHGYQRNTVDVDLVIRAEDAGLVRTKLVENDLRWDPEKVEFRDADGLTVQFLVAGSRAGKGAEVKVPVPAGESNVELIEGLQVLRLSRLIEMKIACGQNNLRRTHKDFADVVELIAIRKLDGSFSRYLHKSVRPTYRELVRNARSED